MAVYQNNIQDLLSRWVAYENPDFTGEQYILDKGMYPNYETWGGRSCKISSVQPIVLVRNHFLWLYLPFPPGLSND